MAGGAWLGGLLATAALGRDDGGWAEVGQVRALLGAEVPAQAWRIEPAAGAARRGPAVHGLVFAFADRLWLYSAGVGTQSLSRVEGRLAEDWADPRPLLRAIAPDHGGIEAVPGPTAMFAAQRAGRARADCFPQCVARWHALLRAAEPPSRARLIFGYVRTADGERGHTVLEYHRGGRRFVFDPDEPEGERELAAGVGREPLAVARALVTEAWAPRPSRAQALDLAPPPAAAGRAGGRVAGADWGEGGGGAPRAAVSGLTVVVSKAG